MCIIICADGQRWAVVVMDYDVMLVKEERKTTSATVSPIKLIRYALGWKRAG